MSSNKTFPRQKLSFKKKGKAWRKDHLDWADKNSFLGSESVRKRLRDKVINQDLYDGKLDMRDLKMILNPGELEQHLIPNAIQHYPIITPRVNVLVGEEKRRKFDWSVSITNPDTLSKIKQDKKKMLDAKIMELIDNEQLSEEEAEKELANFANYVNMDYQDIREKRANLLLRHYIGSLDMKVKFQAGFKDALLNAEEIYMFDIVNSEVTFEKLNPHKVFTLRSGSSNKIEDADVIVIDDYWSPGKILDHYYEDLTGKEVDELEGTSGTSSNVDSDGSSMQVDDIQGMKILGEGQINAFLEGSGVYWNGTKGKGQYTDADGNIRVLRMLWRSKKCIYKVTYFDDMGKEQVKYRSEEYIIRRGDGGNLRKVLWVPQWWKGAKDR